MLLGCILLALAWAALRGEVTTLNLSVGFGLGYGVLALLEKGGVLPSSFQTKVGRVCSLAAFFLWELMVANFRVAADVLRPTTSIRPAVVAIPLDVTSDAEILLLSALINITPGSVTIDLSEDRRTLYVHVMHVKTADDSRREIKDGFERRVKRVFE